MAGIISHREVLTGVGFGSNIQVQLQLESTHVGYMEIIIITLIV